MGIGLYHKGMISSQRQDPEIGLLDGLSNVGTIRSADNASVTLEIDGIAGAKQATDGEKIQHHIWDMEGFMENDGAI
jgi:hypothetical protein